MEKRLTLVTLSPCIIDWTITNKLTSTSNAMLNNTIVAEGSMFTLLSQLNESINDRGKLKAIFICGMPGAGKSYSASQLQDGAIQPQIVNSDKAYEALGRAGKTDISDPSQWSNVRDSVIKTTQTQLMHYINGMLPLFIDSTSADPGNLLRRKGILESFGYDVGIIWIDVKLEDALARAATRERTVPEHFIRSVHARSEQSKQFILSKFEWKQELDNSEGMLTDDVLMAAYRKTSSFFNSPLANPMGQANMRKIEKQKEKYMVPTICSKEQLQHLTTAWYKS